MDGTGDAELLERSGNGDELAFQALFDRHAAAVMRYAWALAATREDAQDLVQETFLTAWRRAGAIRLVGASALPWLLTTCLNHSRNLKRRRARHDALPLPDEFRGDVRKAEAEDLAKERLRWVLDAIDGLSEPDRTLCRLCLIEGRSYKEAAATLGTTSGAVAKRIQRVRTILRNEVV
ncbi:RNA polymerase sigma factor [Microbacterium album]|uniref:DNA-directed RNA polymerase sigma-70 factor n=1 Tax=Microbacterium album TaxID=2053191 RepID=A0A917MMA3_9MICO|nr:RNA polymerase sigma factor [Microbacterium album]GGH47553.1 DNA-directed RNA polymerase sigma-70 factor [Microbacterium album]